MPKRLSPLDVSFLYLEGREAHMHVGSLALFSAPPEGFDFEAFTQHIGRRISLVPRYRQKVRWVPGRIANPVWVDDPDFDLTFHVRRSALPRPGTMAQALELVARLQSRPLDRSRPLWELYVVEGLEGGKVAIITKTHHAMVDGVSAVDIGTAILDLEPTPRDIPDDGFRPEGEPSSLRLVADAVGEYVRRPTAAVDIIRTAAVDARATLGKAAGAAGGLLAAARTAIRPVPSSPLNVRIGSQRRFAIAATELDDYKRVRKTHGGTVNDVVLATVAGALRNWLLTRGEPVLPTTEIRAMVPVSVRTEGERGALGNRVSAYFVDLPVGESNPVVRLHQVSHQMRSLKESGQSMGADAIVMISRFAPPTLHALGARVASGFSRRLFNLVVTNVPGPQMPLYAMGMQMLAAYPVVPIVRDQTVSIGLTSYNGGVYYGLNADRDAMSDADVLASLIEESLAELVETVR